MYKQCIFLIFFLFQITSIFSQGCCSGGSSSPIAEGTAQGVLKINEIEFAANYQGLSSNRFFAGDKDTIKLFDRFNSNYIYTRLAYGVSKSFTMSIESGYFIDKTIIGLNNSSKMKSNGFGDLIIFPKYELFNHKTERSNTELAIGLGFKIPLSSHFDSTLIYTDALGNNYYTTSPPTIQVTNGSHDIIFNVFFLKSMNKANLRFFSNLLYIKKGWNSIGQKFGNYASIGLYGSKKIIKNLSLTVQFKGELIDKMSYDKNIDMLALYNIDVNSTGGNKISVIPQLTYSYRMFSFFALLDLPLYQYMNGVQIGAKNQFTAGISYRSCL